MIEVEIDTHSGFCFGVVNAIEKAEKELCEGTELFCLGDIVHNNSEVARLEAKGLVTIDHQALASLSNTSVLLRAHGEPPHTYQLAKERNIRLVDATCPVVLQLQRKIKTAYMLDPSHETQIVIYGKKGHAEVNGLVGQTEGSAIVIESADALHQLDYTRPIKLYSQTTQSVEGFHLLVRGITERIAPEVSFEHFDTICRQVANRLPNITQFASKHHLVLFVSGKKSSNGRVLFEACREVNPNTHLVSTSQEIVSEWLQGATSIGICGATSTPKWLMEEVQEFVQLQLCNKL